jgi:hypothetical protein
LTVVGDDQEAGGQVDAVGVEIDGDGTLQSCAGETSSVDGWGRGNVATWIRSILDGDPGKILVGGDEKLLTACLIGLHEVLWTPNPF